MSMGIDEGESYDPSQDQNQTVTPQPPAPPAQATGIPDVGPAPAFAQDTVGQGMSKLGTEIGNEASQFVGTPLARFGRAVGSAAMAPSSPAAEPEAAQDPQSLAQQGQAPQPPGGP